MSDALATADPPIPSGQAAAGPGEPTRTGRLRNLVRRVIDYGKQLLGTLENHPSANDLFGIAHCFGTLDIKLIIARVTRGLLLAAALDQRLIDNAARLDSEPASDRDLAPDCDAASPRAPHQTAPAAEPPSRGSRRSADAASLLDRMPTPEEIAAQVRSRPIGAVLEDICNDLGITATHPLWHELQDAVLYNGGDCMRMFHNLIKRIAATKFFPGDTPPMPDDRHAPPRPLAIATGPP